jgi:hypothetical protein
MSLFLSHNISTSAALEIIDFRSKKLTSANLMFITSFLNISTVNNKNLGPEKNQQIR